MTLIKSISGIRGTIGGQPGEALTPVDIVKFAAAYAVWLKKHTPGKRLSIVIGRDARISGPMVESLIVGTLVACGIDVTNIGLATTPTVEMAVTMQQADGGIIITASHNPKQWNALKLLNNKGEFINAQDGEDLLSIADRGDFDFVNVDQLGKITYNDTYTDKHIEAILKLPMVDAEAIRQAGFKVVLDAVNSVGGIAMPRLLEALGVEVVELYCTPDGVFQHNPEPLPENLTEISKMVVDKNADLGIVVDPDVDRLALVCENGQMFGEEYTLVAVADYILSKHRGNTVSNLSSSRALRDVTEHYGGTYYAAAVGEVNVVAKMKEVDAVIGGEGNGGIIYPDLHYGRDALVGAALFLSHMAHKGLKASALRASYPPYFISKNKIELTPQINVDSILEAIKNKYSSQRITDIDGVRIDFDSDRQWVHLRKSNTEPIIRIYAEAGSAEAADSLARQIINDINSLI